MLAKNISLKQSVSRKPSLFVVRSRASAKPTAQRSLHGASDESRNPTSLRRPIFHLINTAFGNANFSKFTAQANFPRTVPTTARLFR